MITPQFHLYSRSSNQLHFTITDATRKGFFSVFDTCVSFSFFSKTLDPWQPASEQHKLHFFDVPLPWQRQQI